MMRWLAGHPYTRRVAQRLTLRSTLVRRYATHLIVSFLRFFAQSRRYRSISFW